MIELFQKIGSSLSGWVAFLSMACGVAASFLYSRFATRRQVDEVLMEVRNGDGKMASELMRSERKLEDRVIALEKAADRLNAGLKNTPTREELHEVKLGLEGARGEMKSLSVRLEGFTTALNAIEKPINLLVEQQLFRKDRS